jgi:hypothetical protein
MRRYLGYWEYPVLLSGYLDEFMNLLPENPSTYLLMI